MLLFGDFFFASLGFHLLHVDGVRLPSPHIQFVVAHAQGQDTFVDADTRREEHEIRRLFIYRLDDEFAIVERDVAYFGPREADFRR